jgi:hypothetical protein
MLAAGVSLEKALGAFAKIYRQDPGLPLKGAMGFFNDGDLHPCRKPIRNCFGPLRTACPIYPSSGC